MVCIGGEVELEWNRVESGWAERCARCEPSAEHSVDSLTAGVMKISNNYLIVVTDLVITIQIEIVSSEHAIG